MGGICISCLTGEPRVLQTRGMKTRTALYTAVSTMRHFTLAIAFFAVAVSASLGQVAGPPLPKIALVLPASIPSETVQISYFMSGPFGGYGSGVDAKANLPVYRIDAFLNGRLATNIKVIAYLPGCEIVTLDIPLRGESIERGLLCKPLGSVVLRGQIFPVALTLERQTEVEVRYPLRFYGIADGSPAVIHLGTVLANENGQFEFQLPDLSKQANLGDGEFLLILRDLKTGNILAFLKPSEAGIESDGLQIRPSYGSTVLFVAKKET